WFVFFDDGEAGYASTWDTGDKFLIVYANPVVPGADTYTFTSPNPVAYDASKAKSDVEKINVFPNPYLGINKAEINKYNLHVPSTHLSQKAQIRIFTLAGIMVRSLVKDDASQFVQWDLTNEAGIPAAAGIYVIFIDMPDVGTTKTLKLAIIPETQFLDRL